MTTSIGKTLRLARLFDPDTGTPELPSPALVVDLGSFQANVAAADEWFSGTGKKIRPHVKTHRTPALALRQLTSAAAGLTGATVAVLVDVDVGLARCGVAGPAAAAALGAMVERTAGLRLAGLMGYEGRRRLSDPGRAAVIQRAYALLAEVKESFERSGLPAATVSSAGTSTMREALDDPSITEIQAGTYALMESDIDGLGLPFEPALSIVATVISRAPGRAVLDVGRKSIASDYGPPRPLERGAEVVAFNEEHTTLRFDPAAGPVPALGQRVVLRPEHVRLTFNLHDVVWLVYPDGSLEKAQVSARGRSW